MENQIKERRDANCDSKGLQDGKAQGLSKKARLAIVCGCVAVVALAVVLVVLLTRNTDEEPETTVQTNGRGTVVTPENIDEILAQPGEPIEDGYYEVRGTIDWVFPTGSEPSTTARVENAPTNTRTVYFDLTLQDTGELIYSSPFIPIGATLENFTLDVPLPEGEYTGIVTYHLVDDNNESISTVSVTVTIRVLA